jgi:hypothetical protein
MGWVVKSVKPGALDALAGDLARAAAAEIVADAERAARRAARVAARETADAQAYLEALETFGVLTRRLVRERRGELRAAVAAPVPPTPAPAPAPVAVGPPPAPRITARRGRATLRESPLTDLFRATVPR